MRPVLGNITCLVLALNGTKDVQVEHESNLSALRKSLSSNSRKVIESVDGVNHLFQRCKTGAVTEYRDIEETISPAVLETIIKWISYNQPPFPPLAPSSRPNQTQPYAQNAFRSINRDLCV